MEPAAAGTTIEQNAKSVGVKAVAAKDGIIAIRIKSSRMLLAHGFLRKIFEVFEKYKTSIDMITTSEVAVSVTIDDPTHLEQIIKELEPLGNIEKETDQTIISVVGNEISQSADILKKIFNSLQPVRISMVSYGGSPHNISLLIASKDKKTALQAINYGVFGL
jgi:aspartate kinase